MSPPSPRQKRGTGGKYAKWFMPANNTPLLPAGLHGLKNAAPCSLQRLDISDSSLTSVLAAAERPIIVTGVGKKWRATKRWRNKRAFLEKFGDVTLRTSPAEDITMWYGAHHGSSFEETVGSFVRNFNSSSGSPPAMDFAFVFDTGSQARGLQSDWAVPEPFKRVLIQGQKIFSIGDTDTGLPFHNHGSSWLSVLVGSKAWFLYPPGTLQAGDTPDPLHNFSTWLRSVLPTLPADRKPIGCLQSMGEVLYMPAGWVHGTMNVGETIGVGVQGGYNYEVRLATAKAGLTVNGNDWFSHKVSIACLSTHRTAC